MGSDDAARVRAELLTAAGGYLRNPVRESGVSCAVCTAATPHPLCRTCAEAASIPGLADLVVPLIYGIHGAESGTLLRSYKDDPDAARRKHHLRIVQRLLYLALLEHQRCIGVVVGAPVSRRVTVPSLTGRPGVHPFTELANTMNAVARQPVLLPAAGAFGVRTISAGQFTLSAGADIRGQHVVVLDDTWTTGSRAQSAVLTLRAGRPAAVSVLVVGRWLDPRYGRNAEFVSTRLADRYDPQRCPVTGSDCPR